MTMADMTLESEVTRPKAVSVIGWIWLIFGGYLFFRGLLDIVIWKVIGPALPALTRALREQAADAPAVSVLFQHTSWISAAKVVFGAFAFLSAWGLLLVRPFARRTMQVVAWLQLLYSACFAVFWSWLWPKVAASRAGEPTWRSDYGSLGLVLGLGVCALLVAAMVWQIAALRTARVRAAFDSPRSVPPVSPPGSGA
jgi:hypothetical protein